MFEYDRLALDVAEQVARIRSSLNQTSPRQIHHIESVNGMSASCDGFDCGSSSGYCSPGSIVNTPLSSPLPNNVLLLQTQSARRSLNSENDENSTPSQQAAVAHEDGFSNDEIAQFTQLLCSPKKAPPSKYQCHICYRTGHYISDCPMRFNSPYEELTPYQGRKKCYGEFQCQQCKRKWTSQNSVANEAQSCIKCHIAVFPHKQLPVDKAIAMGLIKAQRVVPSKLAPIGHGRPPFNSTSNQQS
ncbi:unnamed protein product [Anisakis simplex]|uniref:Zf-3CxxC domain-containing protein n=1 Tax=Anisakis simplex TaxID=6269 RepID=A0A0M3KAH4_ANISI|nr:unnamed protein product [Anisakis simplex]